MSSPGPIDNEIDTLKARIETSRHRIDYLLDEYCRDLVFSHKFGHPVFSSYETSIDEEIEMLKKLMIEWSTYCSWPPGNHEFPGQRN